MKISDSYKEALTEAVIPIAALLFGCAGLCVVALGVLFAATWILRHA